MSNRLDRRNTPDAGERFPLSRLLALGLTSYSSRCSTSSHQPTPVSVTPTFESQVSLTRHAETAVGSGTRWGTFDRGLVVNVYVVGSGTPEVARGFGDPYLTLGCNHGVDSDQLCDVSRQHSSETYPKCYRAQAHASAFTAMAPAILHALPRARVLMSYRASEMIYTYALNLRLIISTYKY